MANNPYVNKVELADGTSVIDISDTTATASDVASGKYFYTAAGEKVQGTSSGGGSGGIVITDTPDAAGGTVRTITAVEISGTKQITQNGTGIDVTEFAAVDVNVPSGGGIENAYRVVLTQNAQGLWKPSETYAELVSIWNDVSLVFTINNSGYYVNKASHEGTKFYYSVAEEGSVGENEWTVVTTYYSYDANGVSQVSQYTYTDTSDGTATPPDVASGKIFYTSTGREVGTASSAKALYKYEGLASRTANSYGSTSATVTVTKAGTYNISYVAIRGSSSGTMGTNLHIGATSGTNNQTWNNGTYGQFATLTNQQIAANTAVTIYATSGSTTRTIYVGQLIVEEV